MATGWAIKLVAGELLFYSGHKEENAALTEGVEIMLSRTVQMI
jgi:hypothetical protein